MTEHKGKELSVNSDNVVHAGGLKDEKKRKIEGGKEQWTATGFEPCLMVRSGISPASILASQVKPHVG